MIDFQERVFASIGQTAEELFENQCKGVLSIIDSPYQSKEE